MHGRMMFLLEIALVARVSSYEEEDMGNYHHIIVFILIFTLELRCDLEKSEH
jgi:hypothetical protein